MANNGSNGKCVPFGVLFYFSRDKTLLKELIDLWCFPKTGQNVAKSAINSKINGIIMLNRRLFLTIWGYRNIINKSEMHANVAQSVEQFTRNEQVRSSILLISSRKRRKPFFLYLRKKIFRQLPCVRQGRRFFQSRALELGQ